MQIEILIRLVNGTCTEKVSFDTGNTFYDGLGMQSFCARFVFLSPVNWPLPVCA
jgi:DNA-directed RNA polymerase subunit N (RpoN/RPB10)